MTVDPPPTNEVAAAPSLSACDTIVTLFWKLVLTWLSVWGSNIGLKLSTYAIVVPTPTGWIKCAYGNILASYNSRFFPTILPSIYLSSSCLVQVTDLVKEPSGLNPGPK